MYFKFNLIKFTKLVLHLIGFCNHKRGPSSLALTYRTVLFLKPRIPIACCTVLPLLSPGLKYYLGITIFVIFLSITVSECSSRFILTLSYDKIWLLCWWRDSNTSPVAPVYHTVLYCTVRRTIVTLQLVLYLYYILYCTSTVQYWVQVSTRSSTVRSFDPVQCIVL